MKVVQGYDFSYFDVDDTLVMWDTALINNNPDKIVTFRVPDNDHIYYYQLLPNEHTIETLKQCKLAGGTVVVWSAGGWDWAYEVVTKLGLERYVDVVLSKPTRYYDDLPASEILGMRYKPTEP